MNIRLVLVVGGSHLLPTHASPEAICVATGFLQSEYSREQGRSDNAFCTMVLKFHTLTSAIFCNHTDQPWFNVSWDYPRVWIPGGVTN